MRGWSGHNNKLQPMLATLSYLGRQITQLLYNRMPTSPDNSNGTATNIDHSCAANHQLPFIVPFKGRADPSSGAPDGIQNDSRCNCIAMISVPPYAHHPNMHCGGQPADNVFSQSVQVHPSEMPLLTICVLYSCVLCSRLLCIWRPISWRMRVCPGSKYFKTSFFTNWQPLLIGRTSTILTTWTSLAIGAFEAKYWNLSRQ